MNQPVEWKVPGRVYTTIVEDKKLNDLIKGIILVNSHWTYVLFDSEFTYSFISENFVDSMKLKKKNMSYELLVTIP